MNIHKAYSEVNKIKRKTQFNYYEYREVIPSKTNYRQGIFALVSSILMIVGVFGCLYLFL